MSMKRKWKKALVISAVVISTIGVGGGIAGFTAYEMGWGPFAPLQVDMTIDAAMRNAVIEGAIADIEHYYVFADKAPGIAKHLREMLQRGDFNAITSAEKLAATLSDVLQQETGDAHFALRYFEKPITELPPGEDQTAEEKIEEASNQKRLNYGVRTVQRLKSNIGYLDLHALAGRARRRRSSPGRWRCSAIPGR